MSRAHPIGLRIASKKLNPPFIGAGQYYSYNQLKYNIVISKSIKQLSKQLVIPAHRVVDRFNSEKKNTKNLILYPNMLPMSVQLKAKQLFDSQYVLNKRRFYSVAIYITRLLKQQFENSYNHFTENTNTSAFSSNIRTKSSSLNFPVVSFMKYQKWKSMKIKFFSLRPPITFARALFRPSQKPSLSFYDIKRNLNQKQTVYIGERNARLLQQKRQRENLNILLPANNLDPYLMLSYGTPFFEKSSPVTKQKLREFYFLTKKTHVSENDANCHTLNPLMKNGNNPSIFLLAFSLWAPVFTLERLKSKQGGGANGEKVKNLVSPEKRLWILFSFIGDSLWGLQNIRATRNQANHSKKHNGANNLTNTKPPFYSLFFQYLIYTKRKNASSFVPCPEWPVPSCFYPILTSFSYTNWQKLLTPVVAKMKIKNQQKVKEQGYNKAKTRDQTHSPWFLTIGPLQGNRKATEEEQDSTFFFKNRGERRAIRELYNRPSINYQIIKRFILLDFLSRLSSVNNALYQGFKAKKVSTGTPTVGTHLALAKEVGNKQKCLYINSVPVNKEEVSTNLRAHKISYTLCPRSNLTTLNLKSIKRLTKQIENFRSDIKLLAPLGLLLHRSFSEPVGINCISAIDNRLEKTYCNPFLKNLLFRRTSNNFLKSNYMNTQTGLLRAKNAVLFDFAYTKSSLIKLGLKKTNTLMQQLLETGNAALWLRKLSSIRL